MMLFIDIFIVVFYGFVALVAVLYAAGAYEEYRKWKRSKTTSLPTRSNPSDDFIEERKGILSMVQDRRKMVSIEIKEVRETAERIIDSSEFASLIRCAHFAGYHLTFEQNDGRWEDDPEYLDPSVFKTDLKEAAFMREERKWNQYKRYFDPPVSNRERALRRNIS